MTNDQSQIINLPCIVLLMSMKRAGDVKQQGKTSTTDWGDVADWYDQLVGESGSEFHRHVVLPGALRMLGDLEGKHFLDIACGQGVLCRIVHERGGIATGVDAAKDLIARARIRNDGLKGSQARPIYHVGDARELGFLRENDYDSAACILAIQNIHPIRPVFAGAARALKPMGKLVIVMMHPCFRGPKETSWGWDGKSYVQYRRVDRYLLPRKSPIVTNPAKKADSDYTWTFHKPIGAYVKAMRQAGLLVDSIEEWPSHKSSTSGPRAAAENSARKEIPMFLAMRAVKIAGIAGREIDEDSNGGKEQND